jgi:WD40 repeat protein
MKTKQYLVLFGSLISLFVCIKQPITAQPVSRLRQVSRFGSNQANNAVWSPNGEWLAVASRSNIHVYDRTYKEKASWDIGEGNIFELAWNPDNSQVAVSGVGLTPDGVQIWDLSAKQLVRTLPGQLDLFTGSNNAGSNAVWDPRGQYIATITAGALPNHQNISLWRAETGELWQVISEMLIVKTVRWSPMGDYLAVIQQDAVSIWQTQPTEKIFTLDSTGAYAAAWEENGKLLAIAGNESVKIWDMEANAITRTQPTTALVDGLIWLDNDIFFTAQTSQSEWALYRWDTKVATSPVLLRQTLNFINHISINSQNGQLALVSEAGVEIISSQDETVFKTLPNYSAASLFDMAWVDQQNLLTSGYYTGLQVWQAQTGKARDNLANSQYSSLIAINASKNLVTSVLVDQPNAIAIFDIATANILHRLPQQQAEITCLMWHSDGNYLGIGYADGTINIWSLATREIEQTIRLDNAPIQALDWHPNQWRLAARGLGKSIQIWDALSGQLIKVYPTETRNSALVQWSPNGQFLASRLGLDTLLIFDMTTDQEVLRIKTNIFSAMAWQSNNLLALGYNNGQVALWDIIAGHIFIQLSIYDQPINRLIWNTSKTHMAVLSEQSIVTVFELVGDVLPTPTPILPP